MRVLLVAVLLLLAGCSQAPAEAVDPGPGGGVTKEKVTQSGPQADDTPATLSGRVRDDVNYSIAGALVAIIGTSHSTHTDHDGRFRIDGILPATYTIRVNPPSDYRPLEAPVTLGPGEEVQISILVVPFVDRGPGYKPHVHDYWRGASTYTMMDEAVDVRDENHALTRTYKQYYGPNHSAASHCNYLGVYPRSDDVNQPALVVPGTAKMRITLDWDDSEVTASRLGIYYTPNGGDAQTIAPVPPATPMEIEVDAATWDSPHQSFTLWSFCINTGTALASGQPGDGPVIINGPIHILIELEKGSEPIVDRPHPDFWGDSDVLNLTFDVQAAWRFTLKDGQLVAPGAAVMEMRHTWQYTGTYAPLGEARGTAWVLHWRSADMDPRDHRDEDYHTGTGEPCGDRCMVYRFDLEPKQTDAYYQSASNWEWLVKPPDTVAEPAVDTWADLVHTLVTGVQNQLDVTLYKAP